MIRRPELLEEIDIALVELRGIAQPHELATLRELALDAQDVEEAQLPKVYEQFRSLRSFCESRKKSAAGHHIDYPPRGRRPR